MKNDEIGKRAVESPCKVKSHQGCSRQDRTALLAVVQAVLDLHQSFEWSFGFGPVKSCKHCKDQGADEVQSSYPCPTVMAITDALEGNQ